MEDDDDPGDYDDDAPPPFDGFRDFYVDPERAREAARRVDPSIRDELGGLVEEEVLEDLDAYFKGVWLKHHG